MGGTLVREGAGKARRADNTSPKNNAGPGHASGDPVQVHFPPDALRVLTDTGVAPADEGATEAAAV